MPLLPAPSKNAPPADPFAAPGQTPSFITGPKKAKPAPKSRVTSHPVSAPTKAAPGQTFEPVGGGPIQTQPLPTTGPPLPALQKFGVTMSIDDVNDHVAAITQAHQATFGYSPSAGMVYDILKAQGTTGPIDYNTLFGIPTSQRDAQAKTIAGANPETGQVQVPQVGDLIKSMTASIKEDRLTASDNSVNFGAWEATNSDLIKQAINNPQERDQLVKAMLNLGVTQPLPMLIQASQYRSGGLSNKIFNAAMLPIAQIADSTVTMPFATYKIFKAAGMDSWDVASAPLSVLVPVINKAGFGLAVPKNRITQATHLAGIAKAVGVGMWYDVQHPTTRPGYLAMDLWAIGTAGTGSIVRTDAAVGALRAGDIAGAAKAIVLKRPPAATDLAFGAYQESLPLSDTQIVRVLQEKFPVVGRDARAARLASDQTDGFELASASDRVNRLFGSTESMMRRNAERRVAISTAVELAPTAEMVRLTRTAGIAKDVWTGILHDKKIDTSGFSATTKTGIQKAIQLLFSDSEDPVAEWTTHHQNEISSLKAQVDALPTADTPEEIAANNDFKNKAAYSIAAHEAQLRAIEPARQIIENPPPRFKPLLDKAYEVQDQIEQQKRVIQGTDDTLAIDHLNKMFGTHVADVGSFIRGENVIKGVNGEKFVTDVPKETTDLMISEAKKAQDALLRAKSTLSKRQSAVRLHPTHEGILKKAKDAERLVAKRNLEWGSHERALQKLQDEGRPQAPIVTEGNSTYLRVYHGSAQSFDKFDVEKSRGSNSLGHGVYLSENPSRASRYAHEAGESQRGEAPNVRVHRVDQSSVLQLHGRNNPTGLDELKQSVLSVLSPGEKKEIEDLDTFSLSTSKNTMEVHTSLSVLGNRLRNDAVDSGKESNLPEDGKDFANQILARIGYKGLKFGDEVLMFNPKDIRSGLESSSSAAVRELRGGHPSAHFTTQPRIYKSERSLPSGGQRKALAYTPPNFPYKTWTGESLKLGDFEWDITNQLADQMPIVYKAAQRKVQYDAHWASGVDRPITPFHRPVLDIKTAPQELRIAMQALDRQQLDNKFADIVTDKNSDALHEYLYPKTTPELGPHVRFFDERMQMDTVEKSYWQNVDKFFSGVMTPINEPMRLALIFATPAYALNALGAASTLLIKDGFLAPFNLIRAMAAPRLYGPEVTRLMDALSGETFTGSLASEMNAFTKGSRGLAHAWQKVTDVQFRRAAVISELKRAGLLKDKEISTSDLYDVLRSPENAAKVNQAAQTARKAMLDFNSMSWPERATLRHAFFVYSFLRSSGIWSLRFLRDHGVMSDTLAQEGKGYSDNLDKLIGPMPYWFTHGPGYFAVNKNLVVNPIQWNMPGMLEQIGAPLSSAFNSTPYSSIGDLLGPAAQFGIEAITGKDTQGDALPVPTGPEKNIPGSSGTIERSILSLFNQTPAGQVLTKQAKVAKQALHPIPPAPVDSSYLDPISAANTQNSAALKQSVFENDGFWNQWGMTLLRSGEPRKVDAMAGAARYWRDLKTTNPDAYHQHQLDQVRQMVKRQEQVVGEPIPVDAQLAADMVSKVDIALETYQQQNPGAPSLNQKSKNIITLDSLAQQGRITDKATWLKRINDAPSWNQKGVQTEMLTTAGGLAWKNWVDRVDTINKYALPKFTEATTNLKNLGLGDYSHTNALPRETKWAYGRQAEDVLDQAKELKAAVGVGTGYTAQAATQKWIEFVNTHDKPISVPTKAALFSAEGPQFYAKAYAHNKEFAKPGPYNTTLTAVQEQQFRKWVSANHVPFNPSASVNDYDMRGYWLATKGVGWKQGEHFPDTYKTPYDTTFSNQSKYATANNPFKWQGNNLIDTRTGALVSGTSKKIEFPSPFAYQFASATDIEREKAIASYAKKSPGLMTSLQAEILTGAKPNPIIATARETLNTWMADETAKLPFGKKLPAGTKTYYENYIASKVPAYKAALSFQRLPLAKRMQVYLPIKNSVNAKSWDLLLTTASQRYDELAKSYTINGKVRQSLVTDAWKRDVPRIVAALKSNTPKSFLSELRLYTGATTDGNADAHLDKFLVKLVQP